MTQDVSNLVSLFSGVTGLEGLQIADSGESGGTEGFSEALMEQIKLLQEQGELPENLEGLDELQQLVGANDDGKLQEFAGLLNNFGIQTVASTESGKRLPGNEKLDKFINIDETLDTLQGVMQKIAVVTDVVEEAAADVNNAIEEFVDYLQGGDPSESFKQQQEQVAGSMNVVPVEQRPEVNRNSLDTVITGDIREDKLLASEALIRDESFLASTVSEQKNVQQAFSKEFEKLSSVSSVVNAPAVPTGEQAESINAITDSSREFLDDMLKNGHGMFESGKEASAMDKLKDESFNLNAGAINSSEKSAIANIGADLSLLNKQIASVNTGMKAELPAMTQSFNHPEWQNEFNERIVWMQNKSISAAELRINPQHLGPVSIRIDMNQDQATIGFTAQHASVKEAIETAIPRLKEMLSGQQLNLAEVNVSQQGYSEQRQSQSFSQGEQNKQNNPNGEAFSMDESSSEVTENVLELTEEIERGRAVASNGLLNTYV